MPIKWNNFFNMLKDKENLDLPLILNGWEMTSPLEKNLRFKDHVQSAANRNQLEDVGKYLRSLKEDEWAHYGDL